MNLFIAGSVYSRRALLRACYWFTDRCYIFVTPADGGFNVEIRPKKQDATMEDDIIGEFQNALLDYQLRQDVDEQTGKIRELLIAKAIAEAGTLDDLPPGDASDPIVLQGKAESPLFTIIG